jgi:Rrf2 family protein
MPEKRRLKEENRKSGFTRRYSGWGGIIVKISTKGRYALRVIIELAQRNTDSYVSLKAIAEHQEISMKYLEMIVSILHAAGFVISLRGKSGGYKLAKEPKEYTVGSILKLTEGSLSPVSCLDNGESTCGRSENCIVLPMWKQLDTLIDNYLESVTIEDLIARQDSRDNYCI